MPAKPSPPRLDEIAAKWRDLAERRLAYFTELYRSGRWRHYYTHELFARRMLDVIAAAKKWAELADRTSANQVPARQRPGRDDDVRRAA